MAKVSIVIPVYNAEDFLHESLDSIVNQTLNDIEIICIKWRGERWWYGRKLEKVYYLF